MKNLNDYPVKGTQVNFKICIDWLIMPLPVNVIFYTILKLLGDNLCKTQQTVRQQTVYLTLAV